MPLNDDQLKAVQCAECILSRPVKNEEAASFTAEEIRSCTGSPEIVVTYLLNRFVAHRLLQKQPEPSTVLHGVRKPWMTYAPITPQNGEPFFIPKQRPGCERTTFRNTVESLTIPQQKVLGCLACQHHIQERKPALRIDRPKVRKCAKLAGSTTANIFNKLEETGHIIVTDEGSLGGDRRIAPSYAFTEEGRQLGAAVPAPESCLLRPIPRGIDKWVAIKVYDLYPIQPQKTFDGLQRLLRKGVLQQRSIDWLKASRTAEQAARFAQAHGLHDVETDRYLMFNPVVLPWFTAAQQAAIAFHFGVDRLLFGKDFSSIEISRALCLGGKNDLTTYVRGLLEPLPDALQRAKE